jgi:apolipoprotein N-acyltransferase
MTNTMNHPATSAPARGTSRVGRYALLAIATVTMLFAVGGRWDIAVTAWIFPLLLLRFTRLSRIWSGTLWVWLVNIVAAVFWAQESAIGFNPTVVAGALALGLLQTLPYVLDRLLVRRLRPWMALLTFPAAVAGAEFLITLLSPFGTAYGSLAVTQYGDLPLLQVISITGLYGIGFLIAWFASTANRIWETTQWRTGIAFTAVLGVVFLGGGARLAFLPPTSTTIRIAGVSPSPTVTDVQQATIGRIPGGRQDIATAPASAIEPAMTAVENDLLASTRREAAAGAKMVIWPEEAVRTRESSEQATIAAARTQARQSGIYLEIGVEVYSPTGPGRDETLLIDPHGDILWTYQKAHPIPGSEPFEPGPAHAPHVNTPYGRLSNVICYDADFPDMMRTRADIMLVPSHDWKAYGGAHTEKASLRAIENGYSLIRQDGEGVSTAFDYEGHVLATTDYFTTDQQTMVAYVPTHGVNTIYNMIGDTFAWLCLGAVAALTVVGIARPTQPA